MEIKMENIICRCDWVTDDKIYEDYHDREWGVPLHDDGRLFEMLILEGMQAGLSWLTVLKKREAFRLAFDGFDVDKVVNYDQEKIASLMENKDIIRNRLKIESAIRNAKAFKEVQTQFGSFDSFIWSYVENEPIINHYATLSEIPANTPLSDKISKDLKKRGFNFVGSTIMYAFMQSIGMVNDHTKNCYLYGRNENAN
jgi:DNA-3-methyladenine glycosylase I